MQTITEAVAYLVAQGVPANLARAAINEQYSPNKNGQLTFEENVVAATEAEVTMVYNTYADMLEVTPEGILFDGELTFNLEGNYL